MKWIVSILMILCCIGFVYAIPLFETNSTVSVGLTNSSCSQTSPVCGSWSTCSSSLQHRSCSISNYLNICGSTHIYSDNRSCSSGTGGGGGSSCQSVYQCSDVSECKDGLQEQICEDVICGQGDYMKSVICEANDGDAPIVDVKTDIVETVEPVVISPIIAPEIVEPVVVLPEVEDKIVLQNGDFCFLNNSRWFFDDSQVSEVCISGWCVDGWFSDRCDEKTEKGNWSFKDLIIPPAIDIPAEVKEEVNNNSEGVSTTEGIIYLSVLFILFFIYLLFKFLNRRREKDSFEAEVEPFVKVKPTIKQTNFVNNNARLFGLYKWFEYWLKSGKDKYELLDKAKRRGWSGEDLDEVCGMLKKNKLLK